MASACSRDPLRQLRELLLEQQEPFLLDVYLLEKSHSRKNSDSEADRNNCLKSETLSCNRLRNKKEKALRKCSAVLRSVLSKFGQGKRGVRSDSGGKYSVDGRLRNSSCVSDRRSETRFQDEDRVSSANSKTLFGSRSEGDMEECPNSPTAFIRISAGHTLRCLKLRSSNSPARNQWRSMQDCKQRSPVSVLEEVPSDDGSPEKTGDSSPTAGEEQEGSPVSASQLEYLVQIIADKMGLQISEDEELHGFFSSSQTMTTKRLLQQRKKLLLDCVREAQQMSYMRKTRWNSHANIAPEMLEKIICDLIRSWANTAPNSKQLARADSLNSSAEWLQTEPHIKEIGIEIADAIFEQTIDEAVTDMYIRTSLLSDVGFLS
ncbi:uncharacterized protein [Aristolochia californica]|uniref:uncharacterized protein n=1 Tax=Aristolochia californica TaxID=171875 RepID=UPI0035E141D2